MRVLPSFLLLNVRRSIGYPGADTGVLEARVTGLGEAAVTGGGVPGMLRAPAVQWIDTVNAGEPAGHAAAAPCAFSLTTRITQRDGRQGTDAPGSRTHVPGPGRQPEPGRWMSPGWRPSPRSPAVSGHRRHPAVPESVLEPRRHQGIPAGAPAHPCAVTRSQLHRRSDGPRAVRTTDEDASAATIPEDPVGTRVRSPGRLRNRPWRTSRRRSLLVPDVIVGLHSVEAAGSPAAAAESGGLSRTGTSRSGRAFRRVRCRCRLSGCRA